MIEIGQIPTQDEVREAFIRAMAWAYEPKSENDVARGKTAEQLAGEAFDEFIRARIHQALTPLQEGLQVIFDHGYLVDRKAR